jgi:STE24 endopeptidase
MNESRATRYQRLRRRAGAASGLSGMAMLAVVAVTPVSRLLRDAAGLAADGVTGVAASMVAIVVFVLMLGLLWEIAGLPAALYLRRRTDLAYRRTPPSVEQVLAEQAQGAMILLPAALVAAVVIQWTGSAAGVWWWIPAGAVLAGLLALAMHAAPAVFRLLGTVRPLQRPNLSARLFALAERARVPVAGIDEWIVDDASPATALVTGVGRGRRILVASEIAGRWSDDEVAVVVAHELAHHAYHDLWRTLAARVLVLWGALAAAELAAGWLAGRLAIGAPGDLARLPLLALVATALWTLATPLFHAQSRRQERRADRCALLLTGDAGAFRSAVTRLASRRLAEEAPSTMTRWMFHSHPSVAERLAVADRFGRTVT